MIFLNHYQRLREEKKKVSEKFEYVIKFLEFLGKFVHDIYNHVQNNLRNIRKSSKVRQKKIISLFAYLLSTSTKNWRERMGPRLFPHAALDCFNVIIINKFLNFFKQSMLYVINWCNCFNIINYTLYYFNWIICWINSIESKFILMSLYFKINQKLSLNQTFLPALTVFLLFLHTTYPDSQPNLFPLH